MLTSEKEVAVFVDEVSKKFLVDEFQYTYNPSDGFWSDFHECCGYYGSYPNWEVVNQAANDLLEDWKAVGEGGTVYAHAHSEGVMVLDWALNLLPPNVRSQMIVVTYGGPVWIARHKAGRVVNYCSEGDPVSVLARLKHKGKESDYDVRELPSSNGFSLKEHYISGPAYSRAMEMEMKSMNAGYLNG